LVCRFHLTLVSRNARLEDTVARAEQLRLSSFREAVRRIGESIEDDFGDHDIHTRNSDESEEIPDPLPSDGISTDDIC
jgi:hypothetical protein